MLDTLPCGHPKECLVSSGEGTHYCAACERGGWVLHGMTRREGLPRPGLRLLIGADSSQGPIVRAGTYLEEAGFIDLCRSRLILCVYVWMYWPDPPPLEGE